VAKPLSACLFDKEELLVRKMVPQGLKGPLLCLIMLPIMNGDVLAYTSAVVMVTADPKNPNPNVGWWR
jgi:hypothetical protein